MGALAKSHPGLSPTLHLQHSPFNQESSEIAAQPNGCGCGVAAISTGPFLDPVCHTMDHDQPGDATSQKERRCDKSRPQPASRVEPAVAAEGDHDVSMKLDRAPTRKAAPDLLHHGYFEQTAAAGACKAASRKNFSE